MIIENIIDKKNQGFHTMSEVLTTRKWDINHDSGSHIWSE